MHREGMVSIWFFIGMLLSVYGVLILGAGIYEWNSPPPVVRADLHAAVWWGMLLIALGAIYVYRFAPRKGNK
jgi:FtsH-binding integral membrane protein